MVALDPADRVSEKRAMLKSLLVATALVSTPAFADPISDAVAKELPSLDKLYRELHREPELAMQEVKTAARMAATLRENGFKVTTGVGGTGVVGVLANGDGPVLLIRTDMDGLPVKEETGLPYASTGKGRRNDGAIVDTMHACGHDIHMSIWTGTARLMSHMRGAWKGTLVMIAQPAEETGQGARAMLEDGLYTRFPKPDFALAAHDSASMPAGRIGYTPGYAMANVDSVDVTIRGVGGHGAYPATTRDPVVLAAETVMAWQTLVSREVDPISSAVVTVGSIHGGNTHNVIGDEVKLQLTVRSYEPEVRKQLLDGIARIARGEAAAHAIPEEKMPEISIRPNFTPAVFNTEKLTTELTDALSVRLGDRLERIKPSMAGEDFSRYHLADPKIESMLFWVGAVDPAKYAAALQSGQQLPSLHSATYAPDAEPAIATGLEAMITAALKILSKE